MDAAGSAHWFMVGFYCLVAATVIIWAAASVWCARAWYRYTSEAIHDDIANGRYPAYYAKWSTWSLMTLVPTGDRVNHREADPRLEALGLEFRRRRNVGYLMPFVVGAVWTVAFAILMLVGS